MSKQKLNKNKNAESTGESLVAGKEEQENNLVETDCESGENTQAETYKVDAEISSSDDTHAVESEKSQEDLGLANEEEPPQSSAEVMGTELEEFESAQIEEQEFIEKEQSISIIESILFSTDRPQSLASIKQAFKGTNIKTKEIKQSLEDLMVEYAGAQRGITLEEVSGGYQLRTKTDNVEFLKRMAKSRPFKLSGPALEVLAIMAYKQPCAKLHVDEIRGVESGHLIRGLMDKSLVAFAGKSELPGKPMLYQTTKRFLEIFGLRNLKELPTLAEIDELLPDGLDAEEGKKTETLNEVATGLQHDAITSYSAASDELEKITGLLSEITSSSDFFEEEKRREKQKRDFERAQDIRESIEFGEQVSAKDKRWLERFEEAQKQLLEEQSEEKKTSENASSSREVANLEEQNTDQEDSKATATKSLQSDDIEGKDETINAGEQSQKVIGEHTHDSELQDSEALAPYDTEVENEPIKDFNED